LATPERSHDQHELKTPDRQREPPDVALSPCMPPPTPEIHLSSPIPINDFASPVEHIVDGELVTLNDDSKIQSQGSSAVSSTVKSAEDSKIQLSKKHKHSKSANVSDAKVLKVAHKATPSNNIKSKSQFQKFDDAEVEVDSDCEESPVKPRKKKATSSRRQVLLVDANAAKSAEEAIASFKSTANLVHEKRKACPKVNSNENWKFLAKVALEDFEATLRKHSFTCCDFTYNRTIWYFLLKRTLHLKKVKL